MAANYDYSCIKIRKLALMDYLFVILLSTTVKDSEAYIARFTLSEYYNFFDLVSKLVLGFDLSEFDSKLSEIIAENMETVFKKQVISSSRRGIPRSWRSYSTRHACVACMTTTVVCAKTQLCLLE